MKFPLRSTVQIGKYVATQKRKGELYPLVLMLEPTLACNLACIGCGKIREYESNKARLSVDECIDAGVQCPAPVVSICGGEPLIYKGIEDVVAGMLEMRKNIDLCTNALKLEEYLDVFKPDPRLTFVVHLDGMREIHDYVCDYPGLWDIAVDAIKDARKAGFRVTTNTTIFKETEVERRDRDDGLPDERGRDRRDADRARLPVLADRPGADDDARRARGEVPRDPLGGPQARLPLAREPDLPGLPHRRPQAPVRAVGLDHAQPVRLEGPLLPAHRRHLPHLRRPAREHRVGVVRPGQRPALRALRRSTPASSPRPRTWRPRASRRPCGAWLGR